MYVAIVDRARYGFSIESRHFSKSDDFWVRIRFSHESGHFGKVTTFV